MWCDHSWLCLGRLRPTNIASRDGCVVLVKCMFVMISRQMVRLSARSCNGLPSSMPWGMLGQPLKSCCLHPWQPDLDNVILSTLASHANICDLQLRHSKAFLGQNKQFVGQPGDIESWQDVEKCQKMSGKLSKNCPMPLQRQIFETFVDIYCLFGQCFYLVTLSNACPWQFLGKPFDSSGHNWETDFLPLLVLARRGAAPVKISTGDKFS